MNQQPDKFFREKLEGYQKPVPASAWEKIAAEQRKKKHKGLWLKFAASLLLIAGVAYLIWPGESKLGQVQTAKIEETSKETQPVGSDTLSGNHQAPQPQKDVVINKDTTPGLTAKKEINPAKKKLTIASSPTEEQPSNGVASTRETKEAVLPHDPSPETEPTVAYKIEEVSSEIDKTRGVTLVYSANEVSGYLNKKDPGEATSDDKKPSTLKKLLKKANDLSNQDPFGELRQKKNEILALNFKNEKRGQNK